MQVTGGGFAGRGRPAGVVGGRRWRSVPARRLVRPAAPWVQPYPPLLALLLPCLAGDLGLSRSAPSGETLWATASVRRVSSSRTWVGGGWLQAGRELHGDGRAGCWWTTDCWRPLRLLLLLLLLPRLLSRYETMLPPPVVGVCVRANVY